MQICQPGTNLVIPHSVIFFLMIVQAFKLKIFHLNAMSLGQDYKKLFVKVSDCSYLVINLSKTYNL